ncbi:hypothetical protein VZ94_06915 [Methylocucumis oryzae]|uniref:Uncharacterized protein n=1 Tax=Methylocucumis oryzae TaxID=1632867 RepID=A0A0F3INI8_9GAMM|nr:hypothetical protein VZ94_06915 [Methylocucumis oryzae]
MQAILLRRDSFSFKPLKLNRHSGRDCRNPDAMDGNQVHPCTLDLGNPLMPRMACIRATQEQLPSRDGVVLIGLPRLK